MSPPSPPPWRPLNSDVQAKTNDRHFIIIIIIIRIQTRLCFVSHCRLAFSAFKCDETKKKEKNHFCLLPRCKSAPVAVQSSVCFGNCRFYVWTCGWYQTRIQTRPLAVSAHNLTVTLTIFGINEHENLFPSRLTATHFESFLQPAVAPPAGQTIERHIQLTAPSERRWN